MIKWDDDIFEYEKKRHLQKEIEREKEWKDGDDDDEKSREYVRRNEENMKGRDPFIWKKMKMHEDELRLWWRKETKMNDENDDQWCYLMKFVVDLLEITRESEGFLLVRIFFFFFCSAFLLLFWIFLFFYHFFYFFN